METSKLAITHIETSKLASFVPTPFIMNDKKTRPPNYIAEHSPVEPQHGFFIVQHLHDRCAPWSLSPIILSYLYNKGVSVLTLHDDLAAQRAHAEKFDKEFQPRSLGALSPQLRKPCTNS